MLIPGFSGRWSLDHQRWPSPRRFRRGGGEATQQGRHDAVGVGRVEQLGQRCLLALLILCTGCGTAYQTLGMTGGYSETLLGEHAAEVHFKGNGYTGSERASDFCLLRCAELTLEHGCRYFAVVDGEDTIRHGSFTYGKRVYNSRKPVCSRMIRCSKEELAGGFEARFVSISIREKYGLALRDSLDSHRIED